MQIQSASYITRRCAAVALACRWLAIAVGCSSFVAAKAQNLIDAVYGVGAGSFELGYYDSTYCGGTCGYFHLNPAATNIVGWPLGFKPGGVDWQSAPITRAADGIRSVDLAGYLTSSSISTTIPTIAGSEYAVSLAAFAGAAANVGKVLANSNLIGTFLGPVAPYTVPASNRVYQTFHFRFVADSNSTTITLEPQTTDGWGPTVDDVFLAPVQAKLAIHTSGDGQVSVCWETARGVSYQLQYRASLVADFWHNSGNLVQGNGMTYYVPAVQLGINTGFYRVVSF